MINSYTSTSQTVLTNSNLNFNINRIKTGCTVTHSEGTPTFSLNRPGFYFISFNCDASTAETSGNIVVQLRNNNELVPGAISTVNSTVATDVETLSFTTIIQVKPSCCAINNSTNLTIINTGVSATFTNANLVITKLC